MNKDEKARIITEQLLPDGKGYTCKDWQELGYVMKPSFKTQFEGQLSIAHKLRVVDFKAKH